MLRRVKVVRNLFVVYLCFVTISSMLCFSGRWECPWHQCSVCQRATSSFCHFCPTSFCRDHERGQLSVSAIDNRPCCSNHDPQRPLGPTANPSQFTIKNEPLELTEEPGEDGDEEVEGVEQE